MTDAEDTSGYSFEIVFDAANSLCWKKSVRLWFAIGDNRRILLSFQIVLKCSRKTFCKALEAIFFENWFVGKRVNYFHSICWLNNPQHVVNRFGYLIGRQIIKIYV